MWLKEFYRRYAEMRPPSCEVKEMEIDGMYHYLSKKRKLWIWKAIGHKTGRFLGRRDTKALARLAEVIDVNDKQYFYTDSGKSYRRFFPAAQLTPSKKNTHGIERNNGRQRHWLAQFRGRSIVVSKSLDSLNRTLALFPRFRLNGYICELIALFR